MSSTKAFNMDKSNILSFGKDLTCNQMTIFFDWSKLKAFADDKINVTGK